MSRPPEALTHADVSWIKLCRHDMECTECGGRRKTAAKENSARGSKTCHVVPPATWDYCDERKRLLKAHFENARREKRT